MHPNTLRKYANEGKIRFIKNAAVQWISDKDACKAVSNAKLRYKQTGQVQEVRFRFRRNPVQSYYIPKSAVSGKGIYHTVLGVLSFKEAFPQSFGDCRLVFRAGEYYLTVPEEMPQQQTKNQGRVVALDPGVRSFMTLFSEDSFGLDS